MFCYRILKIHFNPLTADLNSICHLLALLGAHHILHVSGLRVNIYLPLSLPSALFYSGIPNNSVCIFLSSCMPYATPVCSFLSHHPNDIHSVHGVQYKPRSCKFYALPTLKRTDFLCIMPFRATRDVYCNRRLIIRKISMYIGCILYIYKTLCIYIYI